MILAGRGWGKTRCGAEDIAFYALWNPGTRIGVIAATFSDARDICVEGESGLLRVIPPRCIVRWNRSMGELLLFNGSRIKLFSADQPERLRGPQHHRVWCDETGIIAAGRGADGLLYVLADWSGRFSPEGWAERAIMLYQDMRAQMIVAEVNAGGDLVEKILRQVAPAVLFKPVRALRGKAERAMPVAALYEQGRVKHVGSLAMLEDQMCRFTGAMMKSPDRVDALVWALTELSETSRGEPKIRIL